MRIIDSIATFFKGRQEDARPDVSNATYSQDVMDAFGVNSAQAGTVVNATTAMRVSAVAACVAKISGAIISMPLHIYQSNDDDVPDRLPRDSLWYLLNEQPSKQFTASSMWEGVSMAQLLRGDGYALIRRNINGSVKELLPLPWGSVSPTRNPGQGVRYYVNLPSHGINTWFDPEDILHFPGLGFDDVTMRSMSVIQYGARSAIGNALAMDEYSGQFFAEGAHPSVIISSAAKMNPEQITALQLAFRNKYSGLSNAHKYPLVLTEGLTAKELSLSAEDAQLLEARKFQVLDVARAFGVPGFMINESTGATSWGSGIESIGRSFVQYTLNPWLKKIEQELNRKLFPRDTGKFIEFYRDALIEGDSAAQGAYFRLALGGPGAGDGFMSKNEIRRIKRLAPVEGGDEIYSAPRETVKPEPKEPADDVANQLRELRHSNELQSERITARMNAPQAQAPQMNVSMDITGAAVEKAIMQAAEPILNKFSETANKILENDVPVIVNLPQQPAPIVNITVPEQQAPVVHTNNIVNVAPAEVSVTLPNRRTETTITRDYTGNITKATQLETDA